MSNEVMMLAKNYNPKWLEFPVLVSEKIDGQAAWFAREAFEFQPDGIMARSRQNKPYHSVQHIQDWLWPRLPAGCTVFGELSVPGLPFKDSGGIIRRIANDPRIVLNVYDWLNKAHPDDYFAVRMGDAMAHLGLSRYASPVRRIPMHRCDTQGDLDKWIEKFMQDNPDAEGVMIRSMFGNSSRYKFGRSWGLMRHKPWEYDTCPVSGFEPAIGEHTGMIGRVNVLFHGEVVGTGPGKLTHKEREDIFQNPDKYKNRKAVIKYKPDASYKAMREPTFQEWAVDEN